jgi:amino acid permease
MSLNGSAPRITAKMTKRGVPFAGIALTACVNDARESSTTPKADTD